MVIGRLRYNIEWSIEIFLHFPFRFGLADFFDCLVVVILIMFGSIVIIDITATVFVALLWPPLL